MGRTLRAVATAAAPAVMAALLGLLAPAAGCASRSDRGRATAPAPPLDPDEPARILGQTAVPRPSIASIPESQQREIFWDAVAARNRAVEAVAQETRGDLESVEAKQRQAELAGRYRAAVASEHSITPAQLDQVVEVGYAQGWPFPKLRVPTPEEPAP